MSINYFQMLNDKPAKVYYKISALIAGLIFIVVKITGDLIISGLSLNTTPIIHIWNTSCSFFLIASILIYYFYGDSNSSDSDSDALSDIYLNELGRLLFLLIGLIFLINFVPDFSGNNQFSVFDTVLNYPGSVFSTIFVEFVYIYSMIFAAQTLYFIYKWLRLRRHKKTKKMMKIIGSVTAYLIIYSLISNIFTFLRYIESTNQFLCFVLGIMLFFTAGKNNWIAGVPRNRKIRLFWILLIVFFIAISLSGIVMDNESDYNNALRAMHPGAQYMIRTALVFMAFYSLRIFFAVLAALPTTSIMERRTSEISSLTYLNSFITESASKDIYQLMETVTRLALHASGGSMVWAELYEDKELKIAASVNINPRVVYSAHEQSILKSHLLTFEKTTLIESIPDNKDFAYLQTFLPAVKACIIIPLYSGQSRIGTMIAADTEEYGFEQDDIKVLGAFSDNVNLALENARLLKDSIEKERYRSELLLGQKIQKKLLPQSLPVFSNYTVSAFSHPAEEVGGDYYDIFKIKDGRYCIIIGDVSGKGISASLYMAQLKGVALSVSPQASGPADLLKRINNTLYGFMEKQSYITLCCATIDDDKGNMTFARAGHMPVIIRRKNSTDMFVPKGLGVGLVSSSIFDKNLEEMTVKLNQGDSCILFTDGINELRSEDGEEFGFAPLVQMISNHSIENADELTELILDQTKKYLGTGSQHDDMTVFAVVFNGYLLNE